VDLATLRTTEPPEVRACSLAPNEIVLQSPRIRVDFRYAGPRDLLRRAASVGEAQGAVRVTNGGRTLIWSPKRPLAPGVHVFILDDIVGSRGKLLAAGGRIPFRVVASKAPVSETLRIEHFARIRVDGHRTVRLSSDAVPDGPYFDLFKGTHRKTGAPLALGYDHRGKKIIDPDELQREIARRRYRAYGKLHPTLADAIERTPRGQDLPVAVWLVADEFSGPSERPDRVTKRLEARLQAEAARLAEYTRGRADLVVEAGGKVTAVSTTAPVVFARARPETISRLSRRKDVAGLFLHDAEGIEDLQDSIEVHRSDDALATGATGSGIKVAIWENQPTSTSNLDIDDQYLSSGFVTSDHAQNVTGIVKNTDSGGPSGHAPDASIHSANSKDLDALDWAVGEERCRVVNQSFHRANEATDGVLSFDDVYKDWMALRYPWPLIVHAAGNFFEDDSETDPPEDEYVNHKGYNTISVGNHTDDASAMNTAGNVFSVYRNPPSPHGDRELPELAANGSRVTATGLTYTGTSQAAPAVAGIVAQMQSAHSSLPTWPEGARAILLAGARRNVVGGTWWQDVAAGANARDGSGSANAMESHRIVSVRRSKDNSPQRRGWNAGYLTSSDFDPVTRYADFDYRVRVPNSIFGPRTVKVALTWTSKIDIDGGGPVDSKLAVDLDLHIVNSTGQIVAFSVSWDNSYEVAEFVGQRGAEYRIRIRRFSGTEPTYHGIAWTVTGGLWDLLTLQELDRAQLARVDLVDMFG
jgi:hypothetical protein